MPRQMRRLLVGVTLAAALASLAGASASAAFNGVQAKMWAGRLAALGQRPAGGVHEKQAGAIVRVSGAKAGSITSISPPTSPSGKFRV